MLRKALFSGIAGAAVAALAIVAPAYANTWVSLGKQTVGKNADLDVFPVGVGKGRYEALKFRVTGNRVAFGEVRVFYGNGTQQVLPVQEHVNPGTTTKAFDLTGDHRLITKVEMYYQSEFKWKGPAVVEVFGLKDTKAPTPGPGPGWSAIGSRAVNTVVDHDTIPVGNAKGKFREILFHVSGRPIHVKDVRVTFGNGQVQQYNFNHNFASGANSPVLDLVGDKRFIRQIDLVYVTISPGPGQALVTVYGRH